MSPGKILTKYKNELGEDYHPYLNHVKRVYEYACMLRLERSSDLLLTAAIFHDLDIWVHHTMDYLKGSASLATEYVAKKEPDLDPALLSEIITKHHKLTPVKDNPVVEAFRKADLIDLSAGWIRFNIPKSIIVDTERRYPRLGFTKTVLSKTFGWSLKHPLRPFPMVKL
jgi:hypothetical protein